jgi:hypothetical protein
MLHSKLDISHSIFAICNLHFAIFLFLASVPSLRADGVAVPADGVPYRAKLAGVDANWNVTLEVDKTGSLKKTAAADLVRWGQCTEQGRGGSAALADGGVLAAEVVSADKDRVTFDSDVFGTFSLPMEALAGVVLRSPGGKNRDMLLDRIVQATGDADRLILDNGDELAGQVESISAEDESVSLKTAAGPTKIKLDRVVAVLFNPSLRLKPDAKKNPDAKNIPAIRAWVGLADGSRLLASRLVLDDQAAAVSILGDATLKTTPERVVFLQPLGGRAIYLSDLKVKPEDYRQTPYLDLPWPYKNDRSVVGGLLRTGGLLCLKGIGVHAAAEISYDLTPQLLGLKNNQQAARFEALVCLDDSAAGQGSATFRVLVDGQERFASKKLHASDRPAPVSVDLRGAKRLTLVVDYADRADVLAHADWLDARIICRENREGTQKEANEPQRDANKREG